MVTWVSLYWQQTYRLVSTIDAHQEQGLGDEQADAQVLVDGVAVALEAAKEAEGEEADEQADQGQEDPNPGDDIQEHVVERARVLREDETPSSLLVLIKGGKENISLKE